MEINSNKSNFSNPFDPLVENNLLLKEAEKLFKQVFETLYKKNADYSNLVNPFSNFENSAQRVGITVQQGILVRFNDKVERLCNLLRPDKAARVTGETIEDTICDAIGYLAILHAFRVESTREFIDLPYVPSKWDIWLSNFLDKSLGEEFEAGRSKQDHLLEVYYEGVPDAAKNFGRFK
jgi:hypothetical protein